MNGYQSSILPATFQPEVPLNTNLQMNRAINETSLRTKTAREIHTSCALGITALAYQSQYNIENPVGGKPVTLSLNMKVIAGPGTGKTVTLNEYCKPVNDVVKSKEYAYQEDLEAYFDELSIYEKKKAKLLVELESGDIPARERRSIIKNFNSGRPLKPRSPQMVMQNTTYPAFIKSLTYGSRSQSIISDEGGMVLRGNYEQKVLVLNSVHSGDGAKVDNANKQHHIDENQRCTTLILTQPTEFDAFNKKFGDEVRGNGYIARTMFVKANPIEHAQYGFSENAVFDELKIWQENIRKSVEESLNLDNKPDYEAETLVLDHESKHYYLAICNAINFEKHFRFNGADDLRARLPEQILKIAALYHLTEGLGNKPISPMFIEQALYLCFWYADQFMKIFVPPPQEYIDAQLLRDWFNKKLQQNKPIIKRSEIRRSGPNAIRNTERIDRALELMEMQLEIISYEINNKMFINLAPSYVACIDPTITVDSQQQNYTHTNNGGVI